MFKIVLSIFPPVSRKFHKERKKTFTKNGSFTYTHTQKGCFLQGNKKNVVSNPFY